MALKARIKKLEDVAEAFRKEYTPADDGDGFVLDVTEPDLLPAISGLKIKNKELLGINSKLKSELTKFEGVDLDDLKQQIETLKKAGGTAADVQKLKDDYESKIKGIQTASQSELEKVKAERDAEVGAARNYFVESAVAAAIGKHPGASMKLLAGPIKERLKVERKDGRFEVQVLDAQGNARIKNGQGHPFTVDDLVNEMKNDSEFAMAFPPTGASGSGAQGSGNNQGGAGQRVISADDARAFGDNLEDIAAGKVTVVKKS